MRYIRAPLLRFITTEDPEETEFLFAAARQRRFQYYQKDVYFRGLIEFTNYCKNDCYYCGIRGSNTRLDRCWLSLEEILNCCRLGDILGFRTFVLQGGEDPWFGFIPNMVRGDHAEWQARKTPALTEA